METAVLQHGSRDYLVFVSMILQDVSRYRGAPEDIRITRRTSDGSTISAIERGYCFRVVFDRDTPGEWATLVGMTPQLKHEEIFHAAFPKAAPGIPMRCLFTASGDYSVVSVAFADRVPEYPGPAESWRLAEPLINRVIPGVVPPDVLLIGGRSAEGRPWTMAVPRP